MGVIALSIAAWGLWSELSKESSLNDSGIIQETTLPLDTINTENKNERQNIQLEFQYDDRAKASSKKSTNNKASSKKATDPNIIQSSVIENKQTNNIQWQESKVRSGDSMARIFQRLGFSPSDLHAIISIGKNTSALKKIRPGKILKYNKGSDGKLAAISYSIDKLNTLIVNKKNDNWVTTIETKEQEIRFANARGIIESSLFIAGKNAGLTDSMVMELAGIFGWDIDFILDIREGDQFTVIFEEKFVDGEKIGNRNILAAEFINQGKSYQAIRYTDSSGRSEYYTPGGLSMRKAFLRAPVDFSYISSNFKPRRFHPILKRVKAHNGVDYRAPKGTPVKAAGDGKVIVSAYSKYNGHHVFIQHGQKFVTKYLHFTKRKVKRGQKVSQGQIIGFVGATGLAEAPHLHYEFLVNGVHRNPRTVKLPDAKPINRKEKQKFLNQTRGLVSQLEIQSQIYTEQPLTAD
ncbi:MAG: peptidoglycan DD-metalloendopeptidase family protein [Gammaproteobacteria bacterium]|nr:peptidoglycan DD-metalloendopeptidase family protein [Gammaproteobacteria bacterium]